MGVISILSQDKEELRRKKEVRKLLFETFN